MRANNDPTAPSNEEMESISRDRRVIDKMHAVRKHKVLAAVKGNFEIKLLFSNKVAEKVPETYSHLWSELKKAIERTNKLVEDSKPKEIYVQNLETSEYDDDFESLATTPDGNLPRSSSVQSMKTFEESDLVSAIGNKHGKDAVSFSAIDLRYVHNDTNFGENLLKEGKKARNRSEEEEFTEEDHSEKNEISENKKNRSEEQEFTEEDHIEKDENSEKKRNRCEEKEFTEEDHIEKDEISKKERIQSEEVEISKKERNQIEEVEISEKEKIQSEQDEILKKERDQSEE
ncbi:hypothetical protein HK096_011072, partial [Nowakowskiella sp. JEL0078]